MSKGIADMKKVIIIAVISFLAIAGAIYLDFSEKDTNSTEEIRTYDSGYEEGLAIGKEIGYENGYDDGRTSGYDQGYSDGETDGYYAGATYTCLFYGDVDKAFKSAKNGAAWYTFVDAYDEYITNIYDDNDMRLEIIWALIGATVSGEISEKEAELLIETFGAKVFSDNGIDLNLLIS